MERHFFREKKYFLIITGLILLFGIGLRIWELRVPDMTVDELHYVSDAQRFLRGDPFMSIRHHTFRHSAPNIGHPFLGQIVTALSLKLFGATISAARLPMAIASGASILLLIGFFPFLSKKTVSLAMLFLAISPFAVRFGRDAHIDSLMTMFITAAAVSIFRYLKRGTWWWLSIAGVMAALAASVKLDGGIALIIAGYALLFTHGIKNSRGSLVLFLKKLSFLLVPFFSVFLLLNDPMAYSDAIFHPSDPALWWFTQKFWQSVSGTGKYWISVLITLLSPSMALVWLWSLYWFIKDRSSEMRFLLWWQGALLGLAIFHSPGASGEYGILPAVIPLSVIVAIEMAKLNMKQWLLATGVVIIMTLPYTIYYGLRLKRVGYLDVNSRFNRIIKDHLYTDVISKVNILSPKKAKIFFLPQEEYPLFALREDLSWSYFGDLNNFDVYVVSESAFLNGIEGRIKSIDKIEGFEDGRTFTRYIYLNEAKGVY